MRSLGSGAKVDDRCSHSRHELPQRAGAREHETDDEREENAVKQLCPKLGSEEVSAGILAVVVVRE